MSSIATRNMHPFLMQREVDSVLEGLSNNLNSDMQIYLEIDDRLPSAVLGDRESLRLAFVTLVEFGMRYCVKGQIQVNLKFEDLVYKAGELKTMFGFSVIFEENQNEN